MRSPNSGRWRKRSANGQFRLQRGDYITGVAGRSDEARKTLAEMQSLAARKFVTSYGVALVHAGLGQNEAAFASVNKANWLVWLRLDPRWNGVRTDTRFAELVSRMGFPR